MKYPPVNYHEYLELNTLLSVQNRRSEELGKPAHDEYLFITVHQVYELWFKQIILELQTILEVFSSPNVSEHKLLQMQSRLERVVMIFKHSIGQIDIMETMTPLDFLDFRDFLYPASGFQSFQFRLIETYLGLKSENRLQFNQSPFYKLLSDSQQKQIHEALQGPNLWTCLDNWLSRTPFLNNPNYNFWKEYRQAAENMLKEDREVIANNPRLDDEGKKKNLAMIDQSLKTIQSLFDPKAYEELRAQGYFRLSYEAIHAALFIQIYRDEPVLQIPFKMISAICDLDEVMTQWRYRHALMVHRMLGKKIGTGGSSGHQYLKDATEQHKIFTDLFNLTTFLIPRSKVPPLPEEVRGKMGFNF